MPVFKFNDSNSMEGFFKKPDQSAGPVGAVFDFEQIPKSDTVRKVKAKVLELGKAGQAPVIEMSYAVNPKKLVGGHPSAKVTGFKVTVKGKEVKF